MYGYIEPFYEAAAAAREPGHVWADQPVYLPPRHGLKLTRVNPQDDRDLDFEVVGRTADTFNHAPVQTPEPAVHGGLSRHSRKVGSACHPARRLGRVRRDTRQGATDVSRH